MTDLAGMHSYFWLTSSRLREPVQDEVPYTAQAMRQDLTRVRIAWDECQSSRDRNAIYGYLGFYGRDWGPLTASAMLSIAPVIAVFVAFQRFFLSGMTGGGVKG